ncbi:hypothetical protein RUM44_000439 [Polyplax serrata]|uniref:Uncharacterized protein n=1 Tax=Polyplax serrata TaxID=468196 RepID=A0ABR1B5G9_POLSC
MEQAILNGHDEVDNLETVENGFANGDVDNSAENGSPKSANGNAGEVRLKKKAKRLVKHFSKEPAWSSHGGASMLVPPRNWKNNRRPRNGYGRGLPKKGPNHYGRFISISL